MNEYRRVRDSWTECARDLFLPEGKEKRQQTVTQTSFSSVRNDNDVKLSLESICKLDLDVKSQLEESSSI